MPNRLIKDSIYESDKISKLDDFQFRVWVMLITYVDDFGRGDARPAIIKGRCFPLRRTVTEEDIDIALRDLAAAKCIHLYTVHGKPYLCFKTWSKHQNIRNQRSKYPSPDEADADNSQQIVNDCEQLKSIASKCPRNPIQSNPNPNKNPKEDEEERARAHEDEIDLDSPWYRFVREYHQNIGDFPTSAHELELLESNFEILGPDVMSEAIRVTALKHTTNPHRFLQSICKDWISKDVQTIERAKAVMKDHERQQKGGRRDGAGNGGAGSEGGQELRYGTVL